MTDLSGANPFEQHAERAKSAPERRKEAAKAKGAATREKKRGLAGKSEYEIEQEGAQRRIYTAWRKQTIDALLADEAFGLRVLDLRKFLKRLTVDDAPELLRRVSEPWLVTAPEDVRWECLRMVSHHVARVRVKAGLFVFDDGWGDEEKSVVGKAREILGFG